MDAEVGRLLPGEPVVYTGPSDDWGLQRGDKVFFHGYHPVDPRVCYVGPEDVSATFFTFVDRVHPANWDNWGKPGVFKQETQK